MTPIYESRRDKVYSLLSIDKAALTPAIKPCPAASSYPVVPFICPAKNNPLIFLVSRVFFNSLGST